MDSLLQLLTPHSWIIDALFVVFFLWFVHRFLGFSLKAIVKGFVAELKSVAKLKLSIETINVMAFVAVVLTAGFILIVHYLKHLEGIIEHWIGEEQAQQYGEAIDPFYLLLVVGAVVVASLWVLKKTKDEGRPPAG